MRLLQAAILAAYAGLVAAEGASWTSANGANNWRQATGGHRITSGNIARVQEAFTVDTHGADVSANPSVFNNTVFFPDWAGYLWALDSQTGAIRWKVDIKPYVGTNDTYVQLYAFISSRTTPVVAAQQGVVIIGTQLVLKSAVTSPPPCAYVMAINIVDGSLRWKTLVSDNGWAGVTASPTVYKGAVYVGVTSQEELAAALVLNYNVTFRGSVQKLDLATGAHLWTTYTIADPGPNPQPNNFFTGAAVWGSSPVIDTKRSKVYVATGNNYEAPASVNECINASLSLPTPNVTAAGQCGANTPANWYNSFLALNLRDGRVAWGKHMTYFDIWTLACSIGGPCNVPASPDYDFPMAPLYISTTKCPSHRNLDLLVAGAKSGYVYAVDVVTKEIIWATLIGGGSSTGGLMWGMAFDGNQTLFANNVNGDNNSVILVNPPPGSAPNATGGYATALDLCSGAIHWQAANPVPSLNAPFFAPPTYSGSSSNTLDGVVFYPSGDANGTIVALRARDGSVAAQYVTNGGSAGGGAAVVDGHIYVGAGYRRLLIGGGIFKSYALVNRTSL